MENKPFSEVARLWDAMNKALHGEVRSKLAREYRVARDGLSGLQYSQWEGMTDSQRRNAEEPKR